MFGSDSISVSLGFIVPIVLVIIIVTQGCVKAPPDHAYTISGLCKQPGVFIGRADIRIPFFEQLGKLHLRQITTDIKTDKYIPTNGFINVMVDTTAKIRVADDDKRMKPVMRNFLDKEPANTAADLQDSLQGNMRETTDTLTLRAINTGRDSFSDQIMTRAFRDTEKLGTDILSCNIQNVTDEHEFIRDLGMDSTSKIRKDALTTKAEVERGITTAQATVNNVADDARVAAEIEVAQKNSELAIKKAKLQKASDTKEAEADAAYETQKQEQQRTIQTATVDVQIVRAERETELREQEVLVQQQTLEAKINKKVNTDRYAIEQAAAAGLTKRQREVETKKYEQGQEALVKKAQADTGQHGHGEDTEAQKTIAEVQKHSMVQEVEGIRAKDEAEAVAIRAKVLVEAEGMEKKAEAYQKYNKAAMAEMIIQVLPDIARKIAEPLPQINKIIIIGGGNDSDNSVEAAVGNVPMVMAKLLEPIRETISVDLAETTEADTYDVKVDWNVSLIGAPDVIPGSGQKALHPNPDLDSIQP